MSLREQPTFAARRLCVVFSLFARYFRAHLKKIAQIHPFRCAARAAQGEKVKSVILTFSGIFWVHEISFELTKEISVSLREQPTFAARRLCVVFSLFARYFRAHLKKIAQIHPFRCAARAAQGEKVKSVILTFSGIFWVHEISFELTKEISVSLREQPTFAARRFGSGTAGFCAELSDRKIGRPQKKCGRIYRRKEAAGAAARQTRQGMPRYIRKGIFLCIKIRRRESET